MRKLKLLDICNILLTVFASKLGILYPGNMLYNMTNYNFEYVFAGNQYTDAYWTNHFKENGWQIEITKGYQ